MSSHNDKNVINQADDTIKEGTPAAKIITLSRSKMTEATISLIDDAKANGLDANYVLMNSWFICPKLIKLLVAKGYDVCGMVKKAKTKYNVGTLKQTLAQIYKTHKKRRGHSSQQKLLI